MVAGSRLPQEFLVPLKRDFNPIELGIKRVGVGKKGSKDLPDDLIEAIVSTINDKTFAPVSLGAFLAGLIAKGVSRQEKKILTALKLPLPLAGEEVLSLFASPSNNSFPHNLLHNLTKILQGSYLTTKEAYELGVFLLDDEGLGNEEAREFLRGFFVSYLRVRYESREEWLGLLHALQATTRKINLATEKQFLIFSEPFNGFKRHFFLSPIIARFFFLKGYLPFHLVGRNSGPKFVLNLYDLMQEFSYPFFRGDLATEMTPWGGFLEQKHLNPSLDEWVERRWLTIKRPCWATLEKFINPFALSKSILITSAFHPPYLEKMVTLAEDVGYSGLVVSKLGLEGGLIPSLHKTFKVTASKKLKNGYERRDFVFQAKNIVNSERLKSTIDKKFSITAAENKAILTSYLTSNTTFDEELDGRIQLAQHAYNEVLTWLSE